MRNLFTLLMLIRGIWIYKMNIHFPGYMKNKQEKRIKKFVKYIYSIPFYRKRFDDYGLTVQDIQTAEDFDKLPYLSKEDLRNWIDKEVNDNPKKYSKRIVNKTSGSTGIPMILYDTPLGWASDVANLYRAAMIQKKGYNPIWGKLAHIYTRSATEKHSIVQRLGLFRSYKISIQDGYENCFNRIIKIKPHFVQGNKTSVAAVFEYAIKNNIKLSFIRIVGTTGEKLDSYTKKMINQVCEKDVVFDMYGCAESGNFAIEIEDGRHFVWSDTHVVRVKNPQKNEKLVKGEIVLTSLYHCGFPLVNYLVGDTVEIENDGKNVWIHNVIGRKNDYMIGKSGKKYNGAQFMSIVGEIMSFVSIKQYRIVENEIGKLEWIIVLEDDSCENRSKLENYINNKCEYCFKADLSNCFLYRDSIEPDQNGKLRILVCNCEETK